MGPLQGVKIIEVEGIGPCPFGAMLLADLGADVIRVTKPGPNMFGAGMDVLHRGKRSISLDLKSEAGANAVLRLADNADVLLEGYRPGVMERLGLGPGVCLERNPRLIYGRMTGWGQEGPLAKSAGHDLNYISLTGALHAMGRPGERPPVPLNLVADFGGGGMLLALGVLAALHEREKSGRGQVVDAAMVDGVSTLMTSIYAGLSVGFWRDERGVNLLDSGAPYYDVYETKDGKHVSVGALEPQFYKLLVDKLELADKLPPPMAHLQPSTWPQIREAFTPLFKTRTRDEWVAFFDGLDVCVAPVLSMKEAFEHPHHTARETYSTSDGPAQSRPAPRFSRSIPDDPKPATAAGADSEAILRENGFSDDEIAQLLGRAK